MRTPNASTSSQKSKSSSPELNIPEEDRISRKLSPTPGMPPSILKDSTGAHRTPMEDTRHRRISDCSPSRNRVKFDVPHSTMRNVSSETDATMPKLNYNTLRNRRQSLPVNTHTALLFKPTSNISEARGLVVDMLANRDLPPNVATCLRAVASLLNPQTSIQNFSLADLGLPKVVENPYSGEQLTVSAASKPRVSNITFSTVTSATGLPTIAAEPSRPRSSSYWKPQDNKENREGSAPESRYDGGSGDSQAGTTCLDHSATTTSIGAHSLPNHYTGSYKSGSSVSMPPSTTTIQNETLSPNRNATLSMPEPSPSTSANSLQSCCKSPFKSPTPSTATVSFALPDEDISETSSASSIDSETVIQVSDGTIFDKAELEKDASLRRISEWSFPIFHFADKFKRTVLTRITYTVFREADLFKTFKVSHTKFFNFFHALECGYWDIPYHNRIHAADVLHGCYYLTCHPVRAFIGRPSTPESPFPPLDNAPLPIMDSMNDLELMALYTAAAMHDFDHPGRTNAFLVASEDRKAILYNDRSVLENHHAAESWRLLCNTNNNFIESLDSAETKRFRYLVLEYILATDLKQHFDIIMQFNEKSPEMDLTNEADRVLVSQMLIKFADINSPAKPYSLHRQWTERICQEFYEQGDEEKRRGMPISPYMDRDDQAVAKLQDSFIAHIVNPLALALNEAGLLPVLPGLEEPELIINLKHNHQKWLLELEAEATNQESDLEQDQIHAQNGPIVEEDMASDSGSSGTVEMNGPIKDQSNHLNNNIDKESTKKASNLRNGPNHVNNDDTIEKIE